MDLLLIRQLWGIDKPWDDVFRKISDLGYAGVEIALPFLDPSAEYIDLLDKHDLALIPMIFTKGDTASEHVESFRSQLEKSVPFNPLKVNCHDGRDAWSREESAFYFRQILEIENDFVTPVAHETHRGRILFNPWITAQMIHMFDNLRLCCDYSHWVCVCERLMDDQEAILRACSDRAIHVHGRVGYMEGPQVPDPRAPEYENELITHEKWWDWIWESQRARKMKTSTFTPEFGPPPYMQTEPYTGKPASDLWTISNWMAERQKIRFNEGFT